MINTMWVYIICNVFVLLWPIFSRSFSHEFTVKVAKNGLFCYIHSVTSIVLDGILSYLVDRFRMLVVILLSFDNKPYLWPHFIGLEQKQFSCNHGHPTVLMHKQCDYVSIAWPYRWYHGAATCTTRLIPSYYKISVINTTRWNHPYHMISILVLLTHDWLNFTSDENLWCLKEFHSTEYFSMGSH